MSFPAFVIKAIIITTITVKIYIEPIFVGRIIFVFLDIFECKKLPTNVIKNSINYYSDVVFVQMVADQLKIFIIA